MADDVASIKAVLTAEIGGLRAEMAKAAEAVAALARESTRSFNQTATAAGALQGAFAKAGIAVIALNQGLQLLGRIGSSLKVVTDLADSAQLLDARLKVATRSSADFFEAQSAVARIAASSRQSIETVSEIYIRFSNATRDLGVDQKTLGIAVDTLAKSIVVSGAAAQEAKNAMIQLSQGLASGRLQGDELRSVLEQLPIVARLISKETGIAFGDIRKAAANGQIGVEQIINALVNGSDEIKAAFNEIPETVGQAVTAIQNEFFLAVKQINDTTGASGELVKAIHAFGDEVRAQIPNLVVLVTILLDLGRILLVVGGAFGTVATTAIEWGVALLRTIGYIDQATTQSNELKNAVNETAKVFGSFSAAGTVADAMGRLAPNAKLAAEAMRLVAQETDGARVAFEALAGPLTTAAALLRDMKGAGLETSGQLQIFQKLLSEALAAGDSARAAVLRDAILSMKDAMAATSGEAAILATAQKKLAAAFADIDKSAAFLGSSFDVNKEKAKVLKETLEGLKAKGLDPTNPAIAEMRNQLNQLTGAKKAARDAAKELTEAEKERDKQLKLSIKTLQEVVKAQDAAAKSASDMLVGLQREALNLTPAQERLAKISDEIARLREVDPAGTGMHELNGEFISTTELIEKISSEGPAAIAQIGIAAGKVADQTSNAAKTIGDAFADAFEGIALGTRELEDIPDLFKDAFAKAFFDTLREKSGFDKLFKGNIFDLIKTVGGFLTGPGGFTDFFANAFKAIMGDKGAFDAAFSGGGAGGAGAGGAGFGTTLATGAGALAGGLGGAYLGGKLGGAVGGKTGALVGNLGGGLLGAKVGANLVSGLVAYLNGTSTLGLVASTLQSTIGTAATTALANAGIISLGKGAGTAAASSSSGGALAGLGVGGIVAAAVAGGYNMNENILRILRGEQSPSAAATNVSLDPLGVLGGFGFDVARDLFGFGEQTKGGDFRDQIGGFTRELFPEMELLFKQFDAAEQKFPEIFDSALPSVRALATTIAELASTPLETADEVSQLVNVITNSMGEIGLGAEEALLQTRSAFEGLGVTAAEAGLLAQEAMTAGRISTEEFTQTIVGLAEISGVTFEEMQLQIETLGETFLDTAERMNLAIADFGAAFIEKGVLNVQSLELQLRAAFAAGEIGAAEVAKGLADVQEGVRVATELLGVNGVEAFGLLRDAGVTSMDELRNASIDDLVGIIQEIDKLGIDGATFLRVLRDNGIASFAELAGASQEQINNILSALGELPTGIEIPITFPTEGPQLHPPDPDFVPFAGPRPPGSGDPGYGEGRLQGAQLGGFVDQSGLAVIHRGEEVVRAENVERIERALERFSDDVDRRGSSDVRVIAVTDRTEMPRDIALLERQGRLPSRSKITTPTGLLGVRND